MGRTWIEQVSKMDRRMIEEESNSRRGRVEGNYYGGVMNSEL